MASYKPTPTETARFNDLTCVSSIGILTMAPPVLPAASCACIKSHCGAFAIWRHPLQILSEIWAFLSSHDAVLGRSYLFGQSSCLSTKHQPVAWLVQACMQNRSVHGCTMFGDQSAAMQNHARTTNDSVPCYLGWHSMPAQTCCSQISVLGLAVC